MLNSSTLRPGLLVSLNTSLRGNVKYISRTIEADHSTSDGGRKAAWETERYITDAAEHEGAVVARSKCRSLVTSVCSWSAFGLLCPEARAADLESAIALAREVASDFNARASVTRISVNIICGRIASDDVEAIRAINSEVRGLLDDMEQGVRNLDSKAIREAANKAVALGQMLSPDANARLGEAVDAVRRAARKIVKAGESASIQIDAATLESIKSGRMAFLDLDDAREIQAPEAQGVAVDLAPDDAPFIPKTRAAALEIESDF